MSKFILLVMVLLLLSVASASFFQKPWENRTWVAVNPNIWSYGIDYWWNLPALDGTMSSLGAESVSDLSLNGSVAKYASQAEAARQKSQSDERTCFTSLLASIAFFPAFPSVAFISAFTEGFGCVSYKADWTGAVGSSLSALEGSMTESKKSIDAARIAHDRIFFMGVCGSNYTGPGSSDCAELENAFASVDNNLTEGKYGKYGLMLDYASDVKGELARPVPDLSLFGTMMRLAWDDGGIISTFNNAAAMAKKAGTDAENEFQFRLGSAQSRKTQAEDGLAGLREEDLSLINLAPAGFDVRKAGSVKEKLANLETESTALSKALTDASLWHGRITKRGYLASALAGVADADEGYLQFMQKTAALRMEAEDAVEQQMEDAEGELGETGRFMQSGEAGPEAEGLAAEAQDMFDRGGSAPTLGSAFVFYSKAAALARAARDSRGYAEVLGSESATAQLKDLIARAEKDGINVVEEKEVLGLMARLPAYQAEEHAQAAMDAITSKARVMYEDGLLATRARIYDKLSLAGADAADLYTDMSQCEDGLATDRGLELPKAIGSLRTLASAYARIESALDQYMVGIVGNSMSAGAAPLITDVRLDEPADILLDVVLTNSRAYEAPNVEVRITMPAPLPFLYSDIQSGRDSVSSLRMEDGDKVIVLVLSKVRPFDSKRITFGKSMILAHTTKHKTAAVGTGDGGAIVTDEIEFELDRDIDALVLPDGMEGGLIDGAPRSGPLPAGRHTLLSERTEPDAYTETIVNVQSYLLGPSVRIEYNIRITPSMDLATVPVLIDSINDSRITVFTIASVTGEMVKDTARISETQFRATVFGLKKGRATVLKVGYTVDDPESFVDEQIRNLDSGNISIGAQELVDQARQQAAAGNYSNALELVEQARALTKQDEQAAAKLQLRCDDLAAKITAELDEVNAALAASNASTPFMARLTARKTELMRVLEDTAALNLTARADALDKVDYGWLGKELTAFRKQAYADYNDLKARFFAAGNSSTPDAFLEFEAALQRFDSGGRLEYAITVSDALDAVRRIVQSQEALSKSGKNELKSVFDALESDITDVLGRYTKQAAAAKGTDYSGLFMESESKISKSLADAKSALSGDSRLVLPKLQDLNRTMARMELTLETLKNESEAKLSLLETLLGNSKLDDARKAEFRTKLDGVRSMISSGEYVNALRTGSGIATEMDAAGNGDDSGIAVLGLSAMAILAAVSFYIMKQEPKKELRKLPSSKGFFRPVQDKSQDVPKAPTEPAPAQTTP